MTSRRTIDALKALAVFALGLLALSEAYRAGRGVFRHGGVGPYLEARAEARQVEQALELIGSGYVERESLEMDALGKSALEGMLEGLDPYSEYLDEEELSRLQEAAEQEFGGIGIQVEMRDGWLTVVAPIDGTPGQEAGLASGDRIVAVDGESLEEVSLLEAVNRLRGEPGTTVTLSLNRPSADKTFERTFERAVIEVDSVREATLLGKGLGYVRVSQFGGRTGAEVRQAVEDLLERGMRGLILDLRNNPGGLLDAAVEVASLFLLEGSLVVYTEGRLRSSNREWRAEIDDGEPYDFPLALLVNQGSASASEIVAGALKDAGRAAVVGSRTFGKGSVQSVYSLGKGEGLRLTTARYYTPAGYVIHERGIEPDLAVETTPEEERKLAIQRSRLATMDRAAFVERFEFEPIEDRPLEAAKEALLERLDNGL